MDLLSTCLSFLYPAPGQHTGLTLPWPLSSRGSNLPRKNCDNGAEGDSAGLDGGTDKPP